MVSFWVRKRSTRTCSCWEVSTSFCSCSPIWSCCVLSSANCSPRAARRESASRARSSLPCSSAALACPCSLSACFCNPCACSSMRLRAVATSATPHLLQLLELLLVGQVERVARVLHFVQGLVGLGPEDVRDATEETCHKP